MDKQLKHIISLRENGHLEEANRLIIALIKEKFENGLYHYHCAWTYDSLGKEKEAVPHYETAIQLGLGHEDLEGAYLGL